ncbi:hypothetical protein [Candidatus Entotheonella palauensis]|uniref:hypothetical protein n=1 Tax=Candidatus Entotheonella palauensis TaxID=93172 RepID=UPI000B7C904E|nr:hypothetical protein [Candidatus Entotheonella palauensis]
MKFLTNMKMTAKLVLLLGVMLTGFAVIGSTYLNLLQTEKKTIATTQELGRLHLEIEKIVQRLGEAVTHQRDFLLNRRIENLESFENALSETRETLSNLAGKTNNAELKELISYVVSAELL